MFNHLYKPKPRGLQNRAVRWQPGGGVMAGLDVAAGSYSWNDGGVRTRAHNRRGRGLIEACRHANRYVKNEAYVCVTEQGSG